MIQNLLAALLLLISLQTYSQIRFSEAEILVQSRHVWRGEMLGSAPAIEPSITFSANRFSMNFWASVTTNNSYSEVDLIPSWQFKFFTATLLDYYNPVPGEDNSYLNFKDSLNRHSLELTFDNYSIEKQHLKWMLGTFLFGDKNEETGKPYFSTYMEFKYPFVLFTIETEPVIGLTPFAGYYADRFAIINTGISFSKEIDLKLPFTIPLCLSFISNPYSKQSFVIFAAGIAF